MVDFLSFLTREITWDFLLAFLHTYPFWKGVYSKRKEFAPHGSKFFPFRVDPFSEGRQKKFGRVASLECINSLSYTFGEEVLNQSIYEPATDWTGHSLLTSTIIESISYVVKELKLWQDCMDAQANLGHHCLHMTWPPLFLVFIFASEKVWMGTFKFFFHFFPENRA